MSKYPYTRLANAVIKVAPEESKSDFKIAMESILPGEGRLSDNPVVESDTPGNKFMPGDILFGKLRPYLAKVWVADRPGSFIGDFLRFTPKAGWDSRFLGYVLRSPEFIDRASAEAYGSKMPRIEWERLKNYQIPAPSLAEQERIADELDRELAEIDKFITDQLKLKELLTEQFETQREEIIHEAGGKKVRLSRVLNGLKDGTHGSHKRIDTGGELLLSAKNISSGELVISEDESRISLEEATQITSSGFPRKGDVMMILVGATYGRTALYELDKTLPFQRSVGFFRPNEELITSEYLKLVMSSREFQQQLSLGVKTSAQPGIYLGDISGCYIYLPELQAQNEIIIKLKMLKQIGDKVIQDSISATTLLVERKNNFKLLS